MGLIFQSPISYGLRLSCPKHPTEFSMIIPFQISCSDISHLLATRLVSASLLLRHLSVAFQVSATYFKKRSWWYLPGNWPDSGSFFSGSYFISTRPWIPSSMFVWSFAFSLCILRFVSCVMLLGCFHHNLISFDLLLFGNTWFGN